MNKKIIFLIILAAAVLLSSCQSQPFQLEGSAFALDTIIQVKLYYESKKDADDEIISETFALIDELESALSVHIEGSDTYNLKENAGVSPVTVSGITYSVIEQAVAYSRMTDGLFDVTAGPLIDLWAIEPPNGHVPTDEELQEALSLVDYAKIDFLVDNMIYLEQQGMIINLGAIAKGSIADEAKSFLKQNGVTSAFLNLGGNVLLIGNKPDGSNFSIGVQNPIDDRGAYLMAISLSDVAVVSSGDYERYFEYEGVTYHHILDTVTGYPADTNLRQVTIVAPTAQMADALSTSVFLLGIEKGLELIDTLDGVEAVFVTRDNFIYITDGLTDKVTFDENESAAFTVVSNPEDLY